MNWCTGSLLSSVVTGAFRADPDRGDGSGQAIPSPHSLWTTKSLLRCDLAGTELVPSRHRLLRTHSSRRSSSLGSVRRRAAQPRAPDLDIAQSGRVHVVRVGIQPHQVGALA